MASDLTAEGLVPAGGLLKFALSHNHLYKLEYMNGWINLLIFKALIKTISWHFNDK